MSDHSTTATMDTDAIRDWNASQKWGPHDPESFDGYCVINDLCNEVDRLRAWKAEATEVAEMWEDVWVALGRPGELGEFKPIAALRTVLNGSGKAS